MSFFITASIAEIIIQQAVPDAIGAVAQAERLGLTGSLIFAVAVLWKSLKTKDDQLSVVTNRVAEALAFNTDTQRELRKIIEDRTKSDHELAESIADLHLGIARFPCQLPESTLSIRASGAKGT